MVPSFPLHYDQNLPPCGAVEFAKIYVLRAASFQHAAVDQEMAVIAGQHGFEMPGGVACRRAVVAQHACVTVGPLLRREERQRGLDVALKAFQRFVDGHAGRGA